MLDTWNMVSRFRRLFERSFKLVVPPGAECDSVCVCGACRDDVLRTQKKCVNYGEVEIVVAVLWVSDDCTFDGTYLFLRWRCLPAMRNVTINFDRNWLRLPLLLALARSNARNH